MILKVRKRMNNKVTLHVTEKVASLLFCISTP